MEVFVVAIVMEIFYLFFLFFFFAFFFNRITYFGIYLVLFLVLHSHGATMFTCLVIKMLMVRCCSPKCFVLDNSPSQCAEAGRGRLIVEEVCRSGAAMKLTHWSVYTNQTHTQTIGYVQIGTGTHTHTTASRQVEHVNTSTLMQNGHSVADCNVMFLQAVLRTTGRRSR